jgi:hypothetical protein
MRRVIVLTFACLAGALGVGCGDSLPNVGGLCTAAGGCDKGLTCDTAVPGGYCTAACTTPGVLTGCPEGALCDSISGSAPTCTKICTEQSDCRSDLECNGATGSSVKTCKPKT